MLSGLRRRIQIPCRAKLISSLMPQLPLIAIRLQEREPLLIRPSAGRTAGTFSAGARDVKVGLSK